MSLNLIIGRSGTGKSKLMYEHILQDEKNGTTVLVFVPDFARIVAEQEYFKYTKNRGMINTKITTLKRFAKQNVNKKELYGAKEFLPETAKMFVIKKCIDDNDELFNIFRKVKNTQGFVDKMYKLINVFDSEEISEQQIAKFCNNNDFLAIKFKEIYDIYTLVKTKTEQRFITSFEELDYFVSQVINGKISKITAKTKIYFDGYNNFNKKELDYIKSLLKLGLDVCITLDIDKEVLDKTEIFEISLDTYNKLKKLANEVGCECSEVILSNNKVSKTMLQELQNKIFTLGIDKSELIDDTVQIKLLKNPYQEIEYIAQDIRQKVIDKKLRYNDFKIYYNNESMYDLNIKRVFNEYNIPVYINSKTFVCNNTFVVYMLNLLKQTNVGFLNVNLENIIELLKTGLMEFTSNEVALFENYINEFGIKAYNFKEDFKKNNTTKDSRTVVYDLEVINKIRRKIYDAITILKDRMNLCATTKEITQIIYDFLLEQQIINNYEKQLMDVHKYSIDEYNRKKQIIEYVYGVMDNICIAFDNLTFKEYVELFEYGIQNIEVGSIPSFIDQVEVCNIDSTRSLSKKFVYIIGVFENGLPIMSNSESMFTDKEILTLQQSGIEIAKTSENRNNMALFNVYKAVNSCEQQLILTIPSSKITGENLRYSPLVFKIKDVLNIQSESKIEQDNKTYYNIEQLFDRFIKDVKQIDEITDEEELNRIYANYLLLTNDANYMDVIEYERYSDYLNAETVKKLYNKDMLSSISRLERFKSCPFNYYATYILKLKEKKEYRISKLDLGSIMHKILEDYSKFLIANNWGFQDILDDEKIIEKTKMQIVKSIDSIFDNVYVKYSSSARFAYLKNKLNKGMFNVIKGISQSFRQSEFRPLGFEIEFDNNQLFAPIEVNLNNGTKMFLRGKIDRVDIAKVNETIYLRVVDYKSSSKDLKLSDVKEGVSLQLMTYMSALLNSKEKIDKQRQVLPAALSYFTINTDVLNLTENLSEDKISEKIIDTMKLKGIYLNDVQILNKLDNKFSDSKFSYIDMTQRKLNNKEKALEESKFLEECKNVQEILKDIANELVSGKVTRCTKEKACEYCNFSEFCRKKLKN